MRLTLLASITLCGTLVTGCSSEPLGADAAPDLTARDLTLPVVDLSAPDLAAPVDLTTAVDLTDPGAGVGGQCGGFVARFCQAALYCDYPFPGDCGFADGSGICREKPQVCPGIFDPVCGCNGQVYGNDCLRQQGGVGLHDHGICGCPQQCGPGNYCADCKGGPACLKNGQVC